jgi:hypothetical protein
MRDVQTTSGGASAQPRRQQPILSIRARLIVLALLAIVPLMLERVHSLERARGERTELVRSQLIDLARSGEAAQREIIDSIRTLLRVLARTRERMPLDTPDCNRSLADFPGLAALESPNLLAASLVRPMRTRSGSTYPTAAIFRKPFGRTTSCSATI